MKVWVSLFGCAFAPPSAPPPRSLLRARPGARIEIVRRAHPRPFVYGRQQLRWRQAAEVSSLAAETNASSPQQVEAHWP